MEQVDQQYEYHRLALSWPQHRWWKPLVTALLGTAIYLVFTIALLVVAAIVVFATSADLDRYLDAAAVIDLSDPAIFAFTLASLILMIPSLILAVLIMGPKPIGLLSSVAGRIRWRWLLVCGLAALGVFVASLVVSLVIGVFFPDESAAVPVPQDGSLLVFMLALSILAVPFQAAAEEYVFRGFLMQAIGSWLRHPAFAILLPVPLFVLGHGYDPLGQTDVAIFAVFAGWITWRTGGLEAAIAVHTVNNMTIFVLGALGLVDVNSSEGSMGGLVVSVVTTIVIAVVILRLAERRGISRTRSVPPPAAIRPIPQPAWAGPSYGGNDRSGGQPLAPAGLPMPAGPSMPGVSWDPEQYDPTQYDSTHHDPAHREQAHRDPARQPTADQRPASGQQPSSTAQPTSVTPAENRPARAEDVAHGGATAAGRPAPQPVTGSPPSRPRTEPEQESQAGGHPSGPAHPPGPGYPSGTPYPSGPGYPGAGRDGSEAGPPAP
ncbi:CPBP family intramembrane metalloprotease [Arthrobacter echini]|uniref:CPBP family intramembrane metalloprotease n=1 Tax=Arthrobacter echini TaxID=1529066 RepID=A0A5D0XQG5_9MICC|nr:CPBP family intramembrane glutamic endopeptidase [Arthrobacter echini]TYC98885.1 CPBP family intramembrane metalloprotease [Arthrobacter echini]